MRLRALRRAVALVLALTVCMIRYGLLRLRGPLSLEKRAQWGHSCGPILMAALGLRLRVQGQPPQRGLLVANHLSYLDVLIFGAVLPCFFVSKAEISGWPFFGMMARAGGTLFIDRSSKASAISVTEQIAARLDGPAPVLFFPEGTSTDGSAVLCFRSRLFGPAIAAQAPVTAAALRYVLDDGTPERELCWFGDAPFLPHMWKALGAAGFTAEVSFCEPHVFTDRRDAANVTRAEVVAIREQGAISDQPKNGS